MPSDTGKGSRARRIGKHTSARLDARGGRRVERGCERGLVVALQLRRLPDWLPPSASDRLSEWASEMRRFGRWWRTIRYGRFSTIRTLTDIGHAVAGDLHRVHDDLGVRGPQSGVAA